MLSELNLTDKNAISDAFSLDSWMSWGNEWLKYIASACEVFHCLIPRQAENMIEVYGSMRAALFVSNLKSMHATSVWMIHHATDLRFLVGCYGEDVVHDDRSHYKLDACYRVDACVGSLMLCGDKPVLTKSLLKELVVAHGGVYDRQFLVSSVLGLNVMNVCAMISTGSSFSGCVDAHLNSLLGLTPQPSASASPKTCDRLAWRRVLEEHEDDTKALTVALMGMYNRVQIQLRVLEFMTGRTLDDMMHIAKKQCLLVPPKTEWWMRNGNLTGVWGHAMCFWKEAYAELIQLTMVMGCSKADEGILMLAKHGSFPKSKIAVDNFEYLMKQWTSARHVSEVFGNPKTTKKLMRWLGKCDPIFRKIFFEQIPIVTERDFIRFLEMQEWCKARPGCAKKLVGRILEHLVHDVVM